jgi:hypothetical protein
MRKRSYRTLLVFSLRLLEAAMPLSGIGVKIKKPGLAPGFFMLLHSRD